jgi:hypothetical protein
MAQNQGNPNESGQNPDTQATTQGIAGTFLKELKEIRTRGLRDAVAKGHAKTLTTLVQVTSQKPTDDTSRVVAEIAAIIKDALSKLDSRQARALEELLEIKRTTGRYLDVSQRRAAAAKKLNKAPSSFERHVERPLLKELAKVLADRYGSMLATAIDNQREFAKTALTLVANDRRALPGYVLNVAEYKSRSSRFDCERRDDKCSPQQIGTCRTNVERLPGFAIQ